MYKCDKIHGSMLLQRDKEYNSTLHAKILLLQLYYTNGNLTSLEILIRTKLLFKDVYLIYMYNGKVFKRH